MTRFRFLLLMALICGMTGLAKADTVDFRMNVLDPPFFTYPIFSEPFTVVFAACVDGELPVGAPLQTGEGCFSAVNRTGHDLTGLELVFPNAGSAFGQTPNCALDPTVTNSLNLFSAFDCNLVNDSFVLIFTGGVIHDNENFVLTETGADPATFPQGTLSDPSTVPEPNSIVLVSTGVLVMGLFFARQRGLLSIPFAFGSRRT